MAGDVDEDELLALAKVLSSVLVVPGPHFTILGRIESRSLLEIHTSLLDWLIKVVREHADRANRPKLEKALGLFKTLLPLLAGAVGREALAIHSHLAGCLASAGVEVKADKAWDHQRAYDKRVSRGRRACRVSAPGLTRPRSLFCARQLSSLMAKDSRIAKGARKQVAAEADGSSPPPTSLTGAARAAGKRKRPSTGPADGDEEDEHDEEAGKMPAKAKKARPKPKPRTTSTTAADKSADRIDDSDAEAAETGDDEPVPVEEEADADEEMLDMAGASEDLPSARPSKEPRLTTSALFDCLPRLQPRRQRRPLSSLSPGRRHRRR